MFSNASMNLREWASNDKEVEANIPEQDKSNESDESFRLKLE